MDIESRELPTYEGFIYTLEITPETWYASAELWQGTQDCERLTKKVAHTFEFAIEHPTIDATLQMKKGSIIDDIPNKEANSHQCITTI